MRDAAVVRDKIGYVEKYIVPFFFDYVKKNIVRPARAAANQE